jgi:hypothetical protein
MTRAGARAITTIWSAALGTFAHAGVPNDDLIRVLQRNLRGIETADNGEKVMAEVVPQIGEWHCHTPGG